MCAACSVLWEGFFVDIVNKKDLKQIEMGRSMQMIIDQSFCEIRFIFQMDSLNTSSKQKKEKHME